MSGKSENSSSEEKSILSSRLSIVDKGSDDEEPVRIKLPQNSNERKRAQEIETHLGKDLSFLIGAYDEPFSGKLLNKISLSIRTITALFLDDGNIMTFKTVNLYERGSIDIKIYNPITSEIIKEFSLMTPEPVRKVIATITPKKNILLHTLSGSIICFQYLTMEGEVLWKKVYKNGPFMTSRITANILNDDTVIIRDNEKVILKTLTEEIKLESPKNNCSLKDKKTKFLPYGEKGFISYMCDAIYLYEDSKWERLIEIEDNIKITTITLINKDFLLYGTKNGTLVFYDMKERKEIISIKIWDGSMKINKIKMLTHNRCLVLSGNSSHDLDNIKIFDLDNLSENPEMEYDFQNYFEYVGNLSNGDLIFFFPDEDDDKNIMIYNILEKKIRRLMLDELPKNASRFSVSTLDNLMLLKGGEITLWY